MNAGVEHGLEIYGQLRGRQRVDQMMKTINAREFGASMTELSMEFVFGKVWGRAGLDRRARSLVTLGILVALRQHDELKNHARIALTNGLTGMELEEVMLQACVYAGFPAARAASNAIADIVNEAKLNSGKSNS